jgi:hypothetical protein
MVHRIDDPTAAASLPAPRSPGTPGYFTLGNPGSGVPATVVRYEFMNMVQEELAHVVLSAGIGLLKTDNTQLLQAIQAIVAGSVPTPPAAGRPRLTANTTLYVSTSGADSNDGLTAGTPLRTGQAAWNKAIGLDVNGFTLTIQFADGTYTAPMVCSGIIVGLGAQRGVVIQGNTAAPDNVVFSTTNAECVSAWNGADIDVRCIRVQASGPGGAYTASGCGLFAGNAATINFDNMRFGACGSAHIAAYAGEVTSDGIPYTIEGGAPTHIAANAGGLVAIQNSFVTITGTPHFSQAFAVAAGNATVLAGNCIFSGGATGPCYLAAANGVLSTLDSNPNYFPGDSAGSVSTGGQYG